MISYLSDRGAIPRSSTNKLINYHLIQVVILSSGGVSVKENNHLRVVVVLHVEFLDSLFIFGLCISFLFRSYPYNMTAKRLCQQKRNISFGKKYYVWIRLYIVAFFNQKP